jgi:hypothetical protein
MEMFFQWDRKIYAQSSKKVKEMSQSMSVQEEV